MFSLAPPCSPLFTPVFSTLFVLVWLSVSQYQCKWFNGKDLSPKCADWDAKSYLLIPRSCVTMWWDSWREMQRFDAEQTSQTVNLQFPVLLYYRRILTTKKECHANTSMIFARWVCFKCAYTEWSVKNKTSRLYYSYKSWSKISSDGQNLTKNLRTKSLTIFFI